MRRLLLLLLLLGFSLSASATNYYWTIYNVSQETQFTTADSACSNAFKSTASMSGNSNFTYNGISMGGNGYTAYCMYLNANGDSNSFNSADRSGDSCSDGSTYNSSTGGCVSAQNNGDLCSDQTGSVKDGSGTTLVPMIYSSSSGGCILLTDADNSASCKYMSGLSGNGTSGQKFEVAGTINDIGLGVAPPTFIQDGLACEYSTLVTSSCKVKADGTSTCVVTAKLTGNVASSPTGTSTASTQACVAAGGCAAVDTTPVTTYTDTGCSSTGNCTQETKSDTTGSQSCLTSGSLVCNNTAPKSTDVKTVSSTASTTATDGTVTSTTTADKTTTSCTDVNKCTTSSTTVKSTSATTSSGSTSTSSTCTGSCTGTGTAAADSTDDDSDDEGSATTGKDCTTPPACSGDVYSCAILSQSWINSCATMALPTTDETAAFTAKIAAQQTVLDTAQTDLDTSVSSYLSTFESSASASTGGACFTDTNVSFHGSSFVLPWSKVCPLLIYLRYGLILVAYLGAARMLSREV